MPQKKKKIISSACWSLTAKGRLYLYSRGLTKPTNNSSKGQKKEKKISKYNF
ncbi:MAG: hypothetical protein K1X86_16805 [Ignavibacteria bacterium]|nr:hypothetical protein [Ignavibacteria bacterium]